MTRSQAGCAAVRFSAGAASDCVFTGTLASVYEALGDEDCNAGDCCDCRKSSAHKAEYHCGGEADCGTCNTACSVEYRGDSHCGEACVWHVKQEASDKSVCNLLLKDREWQHPD